MDIINRVNGKSKVLGILGHPVGHSFSPVLQNTLGSFFNINMVYVPFDVAPNQVAEALKGGHALGIQGFNVTVPYKKEVMGSLCKIEEKAAQIGAVNTLLYTPEGYQGYNTDITGLSKCFLMEGRSLKNKTVVILGAGGAAHAAAVLAASEKAAEIWIINRTLSKAEELAALVKKYYRVPIFCEGYEKLMDIPNPEIVIQTTSVGMTPNQQQSPVKEDGFFRKVDFAVDIIYTPWETCFLRQARKAGVDCVNGFDMLVYQGMASFEIWQGISVKEELAGKIRDVLADYYKMQ